MLDRIDRARASDRARAGRRRQLEEALEERPTPKFVQRAAEEDRRLAPRATRSRSKSAPAPSSSSSASFTRVGERCPSRRAAPDRRARRAIAARRPAASPCCRPTKSSELRAEPVVDAAELAARRRSASSPGTASMPSTSSISSSRSSGLAAVAVHLVDEGEDRDAAQAADLEELARLRLDALGGVDQHHGAVGGDRACGRCPR